MSQIRSDYVEFNTRTSNSDSSARNNNQFTRWVEIPQANGGLEVVDPGLDVLLEEWLDACDEVHEHDVENCEHLERVAHHLAVEVRVVVEDVVRVNVKRLPTLELEDAVDSAHVLALVHYRVDTACVAWVPEVSQEPEDGGVDVLHADVGAPDEHRGGVHAGAGAVSLVVSGIGGRRDVVGGHGGGGRRREPASPVLALLPGGAGPGARRSAAARMRRRLESPEGGGRGMEAGGPAAAPSPRPARGIGRGGIGDRERARRASIRRRRGCNQKQI